MTSFKRSNEVVRITRAEAVTKNTNGRGFGGHFHARWRSLGFLPPTGDRHLVLVMDRDLILAAERRWRALTASNAAADLDWVRQVIDAAAEFGETEVRVLAQVALSLASRLASRVVARSAGEALLLALAQAILERGDLSDDEIASVIGAYRRKAH